MKTCTLNDINRDIRGVARKKGANFNKINSRTKVSIFLHEIKKKKAEGYRITLN